MKKTYCIIICLLVAATTYSQATIGTIEEAITQADKISQQTFSQNNFPGMAVSVMQNGEIIWSKGYGFANIELKEKIDPSKHLFRIGSVSKTLTAALMAQLYEEGKLNLYEDVRTYVPSFPEKKFPVHVNELAHHVAGIRHYKGMEYLSQKHYKTVKEGLAIFQDDPLQFEPGTKYSYSSYGWNLISAALESVAGEPFLEAMQSKVFDISDMKQTFPEYSNQEINYLVTFYEQNSKKENTPSPFVDNSYKWAGGGFIATTEDLLLFGNSILENKLYSAKTQKLFTTPYEFPNGTTTNYGLGWQLGEDTKGRAWVGHSGGSVGGSTMFAMYPEENLIVVTTVNLSRARTNNLAFRIANQFLSVSGGGN